MPTKAEPKTVSPQPVILGTVEKPTYILDMENNHRSKISHVFILHGNIDDLSDNAGNNRLIEDALSQQFDTQVRNKAVGGASEDDEDPRVGFNMSTGGFSPSPLIAAKFVFGQGLIFFNSDSKKMFIDFLKTFYTDEVITKSWIDNWENPVSIPDTLFVLNKWFEASKITVHDNKVKRGRQQATVPEIKFTILFPDADVVFPAGTISNMGPGDRLPVASIRQWGRDDKVGARNKIILLTKSISDIHPSLTGGAVGISNHLVKKPTLEERETWLRNYSNIIVRKTQSTPGKVGDNEVTKVNMAEECSFHDFAIQSAGMSRRQLKDVIMHSWLVGEPVDFAMVRERKQQALSDEYSNVLDFFEPEYGFELIGGHENLKAYFQYNVIQPLRVGDKKLCSRGVLMVGPPGTAKTVIAKAVAKEARMNFMIAKLDKLFGGLVGDTEKNTRKLMDAIEAASPVIVFIDELDSVLSSGRQSVGDSGTSARVFNSVMQWLSDESRAGKVVAISASNRPDLLDSALIRSGRFDAILPALPPQKGDATGRGKILEALCRKYSVKFAKEVAATEKTPDRGLGLILHDKDRVWTGAEMEVVLKKALQIASRDKAAAISVDTWTKACNFVLPNTQEVERMTLLGLLYTNDLEYCPIEFAEEARDKTALRERLKNLGWEEDV